MGSRGDVYIYCLRVHMPAMIHVLSVIHMSNCKMRNFSFLTTFALQKIHTLKLNMFAPFLVSMAMCET